MTIIIKLQGLPLEATSVDVRRYFLGLTIPDGGVHIVGGDDGTVFIEFASDEDARQAMAKGDGNIKNSNVRLLLSSRTEMQTLIEAAQLKKQQYFQQQQQQQQQHQQQQQPHPTQQVQAQTQLLQRQNQQHILNNTLQQQQSMPPTTQHLPFHPVITTQPSSFVDPRLLSQNYQDMMSASAAMNQVNQVNHTQQSLLPQNQSNIFNQFAGPAPFASSAANTLGLNLLGNVGLVGANVAGSVAGLDPSILIGAGGLTGGGVLGGGGAGLVANSNLLGSSTLTNNSINGSGNNNFDHKLLQASDNNNGTGINNINQNQSPDNRARMSGMRGGDDKLFANKRCVLAASNIPYRATSKDIIEFLSEFNIKEDCIRRRYNQKGQPTADAKIAFPTPDAAVKALKAMNKKQLCGRPVFLKPV